MPEIKTEVMTVNMGPQHPSTHGVLRLVLELDGETVLSASPTIGYLHTGIEKTTEQKKWQQVIPLVERMDYLSAQSNSMAFCLSVERLLGIEVPERVRHIRVLIAELQRINSHLVWLGTHGMEVGAVSVMLYCFRERELLLNINEMLAGFRMFPSYMRIGGLREDLPRGLHEAVRAFVDRFLVKLDEYEDLLTKNEIYIKRTSGVGRISRDDAVAYALVGPIARAAGIDYDVRKAFPYMGYETYDFAVPTRQEGDAYVALSGACRRDARERQDRQSGAQSHHADRRLGRERSAHHAAAEGPRLYRDGSAHSALPDLLAGLHRSGGRGVRAGRRAARRTGFLRSVRRHEPTVAGEVARAVASRVPGARADDRRRFDRRRHRGDRID